MRLCRCCGRVLEDEAFCSGLDYKTNTKKYSQFCNECEMSGKKPKPKHELVFGEKELDDYIYFKKMIENLKIHGNAYINKRSFSIEEIEEALGKKVKVRDAEGGGHVIYVEK